MKLKGCGRGRDSKDRGQRTTVEDEEVEKEGMERGGRAGVMMRGWRTWK